MAAINKRKILASAQRHLQKGALEKALKEYQRLLEADPRDSNIRLKIGDLQLRRNQPGEAIDAYLKVADQFMRDGFDAKAVAIYKQITKIDAKRYDVYLPLAELYQRLGLTTEAMAALQAAADGYEGEGKRRDALDLLRKMSGLDPSNVPSRLKVADLLAQESLNEEAVAEYDEIVAELERQGDWETQISVYERILEADPSRLETAKSVTTMLLERNQNEQAEHLARILVDANPDHAEANELIAKVLEAVGKDREASEYFRSAARAWRELGDEAKARDLIQRHVSDDGIDFGDDELSGAPGPNSAAAPIDGVAPFDDPPTTDLGDLADPNVNFDVGFDADSPSVSSREAKSPQPAPATASAPAKANAQQAEAAAGLDVEQVLAEASVYARYGKHEKAVEVLQSVLEIDGGNVDALEQLGDTLVAAGHEAPALAAWNRAIEGLSSENEAERIESLRSRIASRNGSSAPATPPVPEPEPDLEPQPESAPESGVAEPEVESPPTDPGVEESAPLDEGPLELELEPGAEIGPEFVEDGANEAAAESLEPETPAASAAEASELEDDIDIEVEFETAVAAEEPAADEPVAEAPPATSEIDVEVDPLLFGDEPMEGPVGAELAESVEEAPTAEASQSSASAASTSTSERINEELEEADFYFGQDLFAEAHEIYQRVLLLAPNHPGAMLRIGEIDAALAAAAENAEADLDTAVEVDATATVAVETAIADEVASDEIVFEIDDDEDSVSEASPASAPVDDLQAALAEAAEAIADAEAAEPDASEDAAAPEVRSASEVLAEAPPQGPQVDATNEVDIEIDDEPFAFADDDAEESVASSAADGEPEPELQPQPELELEPDPELSFDTPPAIEAPSAAVADSDDFAGLADEPDEVVAGAPEALLSTPSPDDSFDLAAELSDAFDPGATASGLDDDDEGTISALFSEFKRGVEATLGEGDIETHFDLGIAYREMGLYDDAIGEFRYGLDSDSRRLDALHMMASCALELGRAADAQSHLEQALAGRELPATQEVAIRFDLARAYASGGDRDRALDAFRRVAEIDPRFQDVGEQIAALEREDENDPGVDAETYESFDDVIESDLAVEEGEDEVAEPAEVFESFEEFQDGFDDDADRPVEAEAPAETPAAVEAEPDPEPAVETPKDSDDSSSAEDGATGPRRKGRRKVSFI